MRVQLFFALLGAQIAQPDASTAKLAEFLKLSPAQIEAAIRFRAETEPTGSVPFDRKAYNAMTTPQRLRHVAELAAKDAVAMERRAKEMEIFYQTLSPEQKEKFDSAMGIRESKSAVAADPIESVGEELTRVSTRSPSIREPEWLIKPDGEIIARVYPKVALRKGKEGRAVLACDTDTDGYLSDCTVREESPKGLGFGNAALEATGYMRMTPAMSRGVPVEGRAVIPLNFKLPEG